MSQSKAQRVFPVKENFSFSQRKKFSEIEKRGSFVFPPNIACSPPKFDAHNKTIPTEQPPPNSPAALPLSLHGQRDLPPNHRAAASLRVCAGRESWMPGWHQSKMKEVGGASTLRAAVDVNTSEKRRRQVERMGRTLFHRLDLGRKIDQIKK